MLEKANRKRILLVTFLALIFLDAFFKFLFKFVLKSLFHSRDL